MTLLRSEWSLFGLNAPWFAWAGGVGLFAITLVLLCRLWYLTFRERRIHDRLGRSLEAVLAEHPTRPGGGLPVEAYDAAARAFEAVPSLAIAWSGLKAQILGQRDARGADEYWASESADAAFNEATVVDSRLNRSFFIAVPGVVTAVGLFFTFLAILVALLDVKIESNQVVGLESLIAGLSGKFVSSVGALLAASIFLPTEKRLLHGLTESRRRLVATIDALIPRRTAAQILSDLHRDIAEQSTAFKSFNTDLSLKLRTSFSESMGPTLDRMVRTIEGHCTTTGKYEHAIPDHAGGAQ